MESSRILSAFIGLSLAVSSSVFADAGFNRLPDTKAPEVVSRAGKATYQYVLLAEPPYSYPSDKYEYLLKNLGDNFVDELVRREVLRCKAENLPNCQFPYGGSGSAFVVGENRDRLLTVRHNFEIDIDRYQTFLKSPAGERNHIHIGNDEPTLMRNMPLHFQLYDQNLNLVFDTRRTGDFARPEVMGFGEMVKWEKGFHGETTVDFASIQVSRPIGEVSLELRRDRAKTGEKLWVIGYPRKTDTRVQLEKAPDSDGHSQFFSVGNVYSAADVHLFMSGPKYAPDPQLEASVEKIFLYTDTEAVNGFSGSPVVDESGRVAGILAGDWAVSDPRFYTLKNAIVLNSEWLSKNLDRYAPYR